MRHLLPLLLLCVACTPLDQAWDADGDGWGVVQDCNDANDQIYPYAPDRRGDGCDADCGQDLGGGDADGDDWPDDVDCEPDDPTIYPCATGDADAEPGSYRACGMLPEDCEAIAIPPGYDAAPDLSGDACGTEATQEDP